jgi:hypothetical protein
LRPGQDLDLMLKYGPPGGHHGHPDKLSLTGWAHGWRFSPDLGTPGYGVASLESWYRQTLSHNTVLLDGESQPPAHGRLERFAPDAAIASVEWDGVKLRRAVHARPDYFIDVVEVACAAPRRVDWIYHNAGMLADDSSSQAEITIPGGIAYAHLSAIRRHPTAHPPQVEWRDGACGLRLWLPAAAGEQMFTGRSPANPPSTTYGFVLRRRQAATTVFVAVFHPYRDLPHVNAVTFHENGDLTIQLVDRTDRWTAAQLSK